MWVHTPHDHFDQIDHKFQKKYKIVEVENNRDEIQRRILCISKIKN